MNTTIRLALLQSRGYDLPSEAISATEEQIAEAAGQGAQIICTQELFLSKYFCRTQDTDNFDLAEPIPGPTSLHFQKTAKKHGVVLILSLFERRAPGLFHNSAVIIDADGEILGKYRKMHIPQDPGFEEKFYFTPGDLGFGAFDCAFGRIGVTICWDQWYPEAARLCALSGANIIFCPTAIGRLEIESEALGEQQRQAWLNVQKGHAVANACYYAAVNRVGAEEQINFWGSSFVSDFYGCEIAMAGKHETEILYADCDLQALEQHRRIWPFFRDRRIDAYTGITKRFDD
ncbi:MAG: carbon-nitrogen hydrolase [Oligosphaeraceae bacterium]|nr:carbon-nitrogen hydrolase [Oligosphaeraceae bacterium]